MYVLQKVRAAVVQRLCDHGGTLTIDKEDRAQQHIWGPSTPWRCWGIFACRQKIGTS